MSTAIQKKSQHLKNPRASKYSNNFDNSKQENAPLMLRIINISLPQRQFTSIQAPEKSLLYLNRQSNLTPAVIAVQGKEG